MDGDIQSGYALNGGKTYYYPGFVSTLPPHMLQRQKSDGYVLEHFLPLLTFSGNVRVRDHHAHIPHGLGGGLFTHAVQAIKPHLAATRWNVYLMYDQRRNSLLHMVRWRTPPAYGGMEVYQGGFVQNGLIRYVCGGGANTVDDVGTYLDPVFSFMGRDRSVIS